MSTKWFARLIDPTALLVTAFLVAMGVLLYFHIGGPQF